MVEADDKQKRAIETVYDLLKTRGSWPVFEVVDRRLDQMGLDSESIFRSMPEGVLRGNPIGYGGFRPDQEVQLSLQALAESARGREDLEELVIVVRWLAERERSHDPDATGVAMNVTAFDALAALGIPPDADVAATTARRLFVLADLVPGISSGRTSGPDPMSWSIAVSRGIRRYRDVRGVEDLIHRVGTTQTGASAARVSPPASSSELRAKTQVRGANGRYEIDVALTFAGEQRAYVQDVAIRLRAAGVSVFYDAFEKVGLWGDNLVDRFAEIYGGKSRYVLMFISKDYAAKAWPNHERKLAQAAALRSSRSVILPVRFDDTPIPGMAETVAYLQASDHTPAQLTDLIREKLASTEHTQAGDAPSGLRPSTRATTVRLADAPLDPNPRLPTRGALQPAPFRPPFEGANRMKYDAPTLERRPGVFLSVAEVQMASLGRSFRDLLKPSVDGFIVSDLPHPGETYTPEEKVNAYLDRSQAVVVFATADLDTGVDQYTRPNIADEIARARSKPHLQNRICVLKQSGVTLASNTNPVYTRLDPDDPAPAFKAALEQLKAWGFDVDVPVVGHGPAIDMGGGPTAAHASSPPAPSAESAAASLERAFALVPRKQHGGGESSLGLIVVPAPREAVLRPSELEDPALAGWLEREGLYGDPPVLERGEGTKTAVSGGALIARQSRASVALHEEGAVVVVRPLKREADQNSFFQGIIEEDVLADLQADLAFVDRVLAHIDQAGRVSHFIPVATLLGAGYTAWRTRAEQAASPSSMTLNIRGGDEIVTRLSSPAQPRSALSEGRSDLAMDLLVLLRRAAREGS